MLIYTSVLYKYLFNDIFLWITCTGKKILQHYTYIIFFATNNVRSTTSSVILHYLTFKYYNSSRKICTYIHYRKCIS